MPKYIGVFILSLAFFALMSCGDKPKLVVVTYQLSRRADTTFNRQYRDQINRELDSLCIVNRSEYYQSTFDSIMRIELSKIQKLLE